MQTTRPMHNAIDIKTKVLLPRTYVILGRFWLSCSGPLALLLPNTFELFGFDFFRFRSYLMKVIPETRCVHYI